MPKPNSVGCYRQSAIVAYINKQGGTHSVETCAFLWKIMTSCHHYQITLKSQAHPGCLIVMAYPLQSNQQTGHCICRCLNRFVKWFTPHVDLFATHRNHINIHWLGLTAYAFPLTALLHRVIQKSGNLTVSSL